MKNKRPLPAGEMEAASQHSGITRGVTWCDLAVVGMTTGTPQLGRKPETHDQMFRLARPKKALLFAGQDWCVPRAKARGGIQVCSD